MDTGVRVLHLDKILLAIWLTSERDPPREEFDVCVTAITAAMREHHIPNTGLRTFVVSDGGAPNVRQRKQLSAMTEQQPSKSAVITTVLSNPIKRGIATALSWTNPAMRFFMPEEIRDALRHIELPNERARIWEELMILQKELPPSRTLDLIKRVR